MDSMEDVDSKDKYKKQRITKKMTYSSRLKPMVVKDEIYDPKFEKKKFESDFPSIKEEFQRKGQHEPEPPEVGGLDIPD